MNIQLTENYLAYDQIVFPVLCYYLSFISVFLPAYWTFPFGCLDVTLTSVCLILHA